MKASLHPHHIHPGVYGHGILSICTCTMRLHVTFTLATAQSHGTRYIARSNDEDQHQYQIQHKAGSSSASTTLKSVLSLVCYTRPDLIPSSSTDYAVAVVVQGAGNEGRTMEGRGMMSWLLAENGKGQSRMSGRVTEGGDVLEVALELMPVSPRFGCHADGRHRIEDSDGFSTGRQLDANASWVYDSAHRYRRTTSPRTSTPRAARHQLLPLQAIKTIMLYRQTRSPTWLLPPGTPTTATQ